MGAVVLAAVAVAASTASAVDDPVRARLTAGERAVVEVTIAPGWHVNSHAPRDEFLIPTSVTLTPPPGVKAGEVEYPAPVERRLKFGGDKTFQLYEGTVRLTAPLDGTPAPGGPPLRATLRYQ
ncbi:MAG TPA: protein-disulfide reductase DsbD domain-containing protein, partial [Candidatus Binatia bacterium]|nr:protein-disulfide reductase DsbD domain-containing protein [Candidatus Binatia bacterium]